MCRRSAYLLQPVDHDHWSENGMRRKLKEHLYDIGILLVVVWDVFPTCADACESEVAGKITSTVTGQSAFHLEPVKTGRF